MPIKKKTNFISTTSRFPLNNLYMWYFHLYDRSLKCYSIKY